MAAPIRIVVEVDRELDSESARETGVVAAPTKEFMSELRANLEEYMRDFYAGRVDGVRVTIDGGSEKE